MDELITAYETTEEEQFHFNVGGWLFSVPPGKLSQYPDSILWKEASVIPQSDYPRLFIDRDGFTFRHVHYFLHTSKLSFSSCSELSLLYEQALFLQLTPLLQALDNLKEGKHNLRVRQTADVPVAERASMNYWKTRKCKNRPSEFPIKSPAYTGLHDKAPLGLIDTPLLDTEEEVHYCFISVDVLGKYPVLINDDNLLWLAEDFALIETGCSEFRFIANFLNSGKILLPDDFSGMDMLELETELLQIPELTEVVKYQRNILGCSSREGSIMHQFGQGAQIKNIEVQKAAKPFYIMTLGLLVKYPDSALGQLHVESTIDGNKLFISGNGVLFQHVKNWLGTCNLPLTENIAELCGLCTYLDTRDITYEPIKDAVKCFLRKKTNMQIHKINEKWAAEIKVYSLNQIVKIYVGSYWYATYLKTLLKNSEILLNQTKVHWIRWGLTLQINGDGQMFRHVLNFLRLGKLLLPNEFKEWSLLSQELEEYQIPSLLNALYNSEGYRLWIKEKESQNEAECTPKETMIPGEAVGTGASGTSQIHLPNPDNLNDNHMAIWSKIKDNPSGQQFERQNDKSPHLITQTKGTKRLHSEKSEGPTQAPVVTGNSAGALQLVSPPRKRRARSVLLTKKPEWREMPTTPMQRLISLVKEWDMLNSKQCALQCMSTQNVQQEKASAKDTANASDTLHKTAVVSSEIGHSTENEKKAGQPSMSPGKKVLQYSFKHCHSSHEKGLLSKQIIMGEGYLKKKTGVPRFKWMSDQEEERSILPTKCRERGNNDPLGITIEDFGNAGIILKVEHPPVVGIDGSIVSMKDSVVYTTKSLDIKMINPEAQRMPKDTAFLSFNMSHEEMFYARKCHFFLTDIILDSMRHKDPKRITAKVVYLVNKLWTLQISSKEFVEKLLTTECFRRDSHIYDKLLGWADFTLPLAWKYSDCVETLVKKGYYKSISFSILEKYLQ
ncbi:BTB/POZ domain-containing protein KCTD19 isoform X2 [Lissotriton helveticus]